MKPVPIADFREKITLCKITTTVDEELNRINTIVPKKQVWANVTAKSNVDNTIAATRPELHYKFIIRKQDALQCDAVIYRGRTLMITVPYYEVDNKYIVIEAGEIVGTAD